LLRSPPMAIFGRHLLRPQRGLVGKRDAAAEIAQRVGGHAVACGRWASMAWPAAGGQARWPVVTLGGRWQGGHTRVVALIYFLYLFSYLIC
jgi:hypothetical protein